MFNWSVSIDEIIKLYKMVFVFFIAFDIFGLFWIKNEIGVFVFESKSFSIISLLIGVEKML